MDKVLTAKFEKVGHETARLILSGTAGILTIAEYDVAGARRSEIACEFAGIIEEWNKPRLPVAFEADWPISTHGAYTVRAKLQRIIGAFPVGCAA